ncbi:MAG: hypothetical protein AAFX44_08860 [Pseudomonadota bacterium]
MLLHSATLRTQWLPAVLALAVLAAGLVTSGHHHDDGEVHADCSICVTDIALDAAAADCAGAASLKTPGISDERFMPFEASPVPIAELHARGPPENPLI